MKSLIGVSLVIGFAASAAAQSVEISPFAGYRWGGQIDEEQTAVAMDLDVDRGGSYGLVVEFPLVRDFGGPAPAGLSFELSASRQGTELVIDPGLFGEGETLSDIDVTYYQAGVSLLFPHRSVTPFIAASLGFTTLEPEEPELDDETRFSGSIGAGAKVWISDNLGFRFEFRGFMTALGADDNEFCDRFGCEEEFDTMNQGEARLGLVLSF